MRARILEPRKKVRGQGWGRGREERRERTVIVADRLVSEKLERSEEDLVRPVGDDGAVSEGEGGGGGR